MSDAVIRKFLDLSTAHMTFNDSQILDNQPDRLTGIVYPEGCFIYTGSRDDDGEELILKTMREVGLSEAFLNVIKYARDSQCDYVMFDRDAEVNDDLQTFDW